MFSQKRITNAFNRAKVIKFNNNSKFAIMSDCHRGDGGRTDNFLKNQDIFFSALQRYCLDGFTYIELGDGDELWEIKNMSDIVEVYSETFSLLAEFHAKNRLYMLFGNHDIVKSHPKRSPSFFKHIEMHESLLLEHVDTGKSIFLLHGHQADFINSVLSVVTGFFVRHAWRRLELIGYKDPTSAAKNYTLRKRVERGLLRWIKANNQPLMAGHTHRPTIPGPSELPYYNTGSSVHPQSITAIEITNGCATLVKWTRKTKPNGILYVGKEVIAGPREI